MSEPLEKGSARYEANLSLFRSMMGPSPFSFGAYVKRWQKKCRSWHKLHDERREKRGRR